MLVCGAKVGVCPPMPVIAAWSNDIRRQRGYSPISGTAFFFGGGSGGDCLKAFWKKLVGGVSGVRA